jgi:antibiotic biosynthesis monooxygenase (ABM) superfamily enzyme
MAARSAVSTGGDVHHGDGRRSPLVVITRRAVPGRRRAFERWLRELEAAARRAPGFIGMQITEPDDRHPDDWGVVYRFRTPEALEAWLTSDARAAVVEAGAELVASPPREQRLAVAVDHDPVTAVSSVMVRAGEEAEYQRRHAELVTILEQFNGFLRAELFQPVTGVQDETVVVLTFAARHDLDGWLASPERAEALARLEPMVQGDRTLNVVGGFAGWFGDGPSSVRRYKQALIVLLALFPTALAIGLLRQFFAPDLPFALATLLGNAAGVAVLTWLVMPPLTKLLDGWLRR